MAKPQSATTRRIAWIVSAVLMGGVIGCDGAAADPDAPLETYLERDVLFVDPGDVRRYMDAGNDDVVFVDNRNSFAFQQERIAGARLIQTEAMARSVGSLPLNKWIVLYCT
jgi:hypothetical protein